MNQVNPDPKDLLKVSLRKRINTTGFGFQYAVLKTAEELFNKKTSPWIFSVAEFPVEVRGQPTRIDFILPHNTADLWLVCECKRANPAFSDWCFLNTVYVHRGQDYSQIVAETFNWSSNAHNPYTNITEVYSPSEKIYNLGIEFKRGQRGDQSSGGRGVIEEAIGQALRGINGLVEFLGNEMHQSEAGLGINLFEEDFRIRLLPVVFTTANLWVTDVDLSSSDVSTGELPDTDWNLEPADWLWYLYPQSPGLRHTLAVQQRDNSYDILVQALKEEYLRPVAIVSANGISSFLAMDHFNYL